MKKKFLIPAGLLTLVFIVYLIYDLQHPEITTYSDNMYFSASYFVLTLLFYVLSFTKKEYLTGLRVVSLVCVLSALFFIILSIYSGVSNIYLPIGLGFNCIGLCLNSIAQKKAK